MNITEMLQSFKTSLFNVDGLNTALMVGVLFMLLVVWRAHKSKTSPFNIFDIIMENDRVSKVACFGVGAFLLTGWMMVKLTQTGKMTEGYFGLFLTAWVAPIIAKILSGPQPASTVSSSSTVSADGSIINSSVKKTEPQP